MRYLNLSIILCLTACTYEELIPIAEELIEISVEEIEEYLEENDGSKN